MSKRKGDPKDVPIVEKLYRENQICYASSGGFGRADDEREERRERITEAIKSRRDRLYQHVPKPDDCQECEAPLGESELWERFNFPVCSECRDRDVRHKLIHRTEAKERFLLKDCDLDLRKPPLRFISKKNPHNPRYGDMKLYLLPQLEARALEVHGSTEKLEELKEIREAKREATNERRFEKKIKTMRNDMRLAEKPVVLKKQGHVHSFGPEVHNKKKDTYSKTCTECSFVMKYEKM
uniref:XPA C-terminal domain-containing protein n=1 Tax=Panagrolaimus sp. PS1159 TaxID=55785 RepID=A0AC35FP72_9BILA